MSCEMAAHPFQAHANYGTWSIDFGYDIPFNFFLSIFFNSRTLFEIFIDFRIVSVEVKP